MPPQRRITCPANKNSLTIANWAASRNIGAWPTPRISATVAFGPRLPGQPKRYVQDRIRERHDDVWRRLNDEHCYIYLCGLKGMEQDVDEAFRDVCRRHGGDWDRLLPQLREKGRYHIETY